MDSTAIAPSRKKYATLIETMLRQLRVQKQNHATPGSHAPAISIKPGFNKKQFLAGLFCLTIGLVLYLFFRPFSATYFLSSFSEYQTLIPLLSSPQGDITAFAPDYFHPLAMSLLTMAMVSSARSRGIICLTWLSIDFVFEISQLYGSEIVQHMPEWFSSIPAIEPLRNYALKGTFDPLDLVAISAGCITAFLVGELLSNEKAFT